MIHDITPPPASTSYEQIVWLTGPRLIAILFNWALLGVLTAQVYVYFLNFPNDRWALKTLVYGLYILDCIQTGAATYDTFQWFVYGFANINNLYNVYTDWLNVPLLSSIIGAIVQSFFAWRILIFSNSRIVFVFIVTLAQVQLGSGIAAAVYLFIDPSEVSRSSGLVRAVAIRLGSSAFVDVVIAVAMTFYLVRSRQRALAHMNNILTRLIRLTVETGSVTALMAILDLIFFLTQHNALHQVPGITLGKLYSNTLLVIFNNRMVMEQRSHPSSGAMQLSHSFRRPREDLQDDPDRGGSNVEVDSVKRPEFGLDEARRAENIEWQRNSGF